MHSAQIVGIKSLYDSRFTFLTFEMRILVRCEESQAVTIAFRNKGHEAFSNDILECSGGFPDWHFKCDTFNIDPGNFDLSISFPPCTDLAVSGARWFEEKRNSGSQYKAIRFFFEIWKISNCVENPVGIMNSGGYIKKWFPKLYEEMKSFGFPFSPSQIIQPYEFGHPESKKTCLWLNGLPKLKPTNILEIPKCGYWENQTASGQNKLGPSPDRAKIRSKTYQGIADAMAVQWGNISDVQYFKQLKLC